MELNLDMTTRGQTRMASDKLFEIVCSCLFINLEEKTTTAERQRQHMIANLSTSFNVNSMCLPSGPRADLCHGSSECS